MDSQSKKSSREAHAYTPGLKIKKSEVVRKTRVLPIEGELLVDVGDEVGFDTDIARTEIPGDPIMINISETIGTDPILVPKFMSKGIGEWVEKGEVIAKDIAFFGLLKKFVYSPIRGYIENVSDVTGHVILRGLPVSISVSSYIPGRVTAIIPKRGAIIEVNAAIIQGIFGIGGQSHGTIEVAVSSPNEVITEDMIYSEHRGKVIVGGSMVTGKAYVKAMEVGAKGVVVGGIDVEDLIEILGEDIGVAITGEEEISTPLIVTEGFGEMPMSKRAYELLSNLEGKMTAINGTTQIRAGVIRPEIIIPYDDLIRIEKPHDELSKGMKTGSLVRIIREPYFGEIATVVSLPVELKEIETESDVRVMEVQLEDGRIVIIPRANVEVIEE